MAPLSVKSEIAKSETGNVLKSKEIETQILTSFSDWLQSYKLYLITSIYPANPNLILAQEGKFLET